jgi:hypothetical protein
VPVVAVVVEDASWLSDIKVEVSIYPLPSTLSNSGVEELTMIFKKVPARKLVLLANALVLLSYGLMAFETPFVGARDMGLAGAGGSNHVDPYIMSRNPGHLGLWDAWGQSMSFKRGATAAFGIGDSDDGLPWMNHRENPEFKNRPHDNFNPYEGEYPSKIGHRDLVDVVAMRLTGGFQSVNKGAFYDKRYEGVADSSVNGPSFSLQVSPWLWWHHRKSWAERRDNLFEEIDNVMVEDDFLLGLDEEFLWFFKYLRDHSFAYYQADRTAVNFLTDWEVVEQGVSWAYRVDRAFSLGVTAGSTSLQTHFSPTENIVDESVSFFNAGLSYIVSENDSRLFLLGLSFRSSDGNWSDKVEFSARYDSLSMPLTTFFTYASHQWSGFQAELPDITRYSLGFEWSPNLLTRWRWAKWHFRFGISMGDELATSTGAFATEIGILNKDFVSFGLGYMDDRLEIDVGVTNTLNTPSSGAVDPAYDSSLAFAAQVGWKFGYKKGE